MLSLGMLLNKANTVHTIKTAVKPDQKDCPEVFPIKSADKKATIATTHQGKKYPLANERIRIIRNSILYYLSINVDFILADCSVAEFKNNNSFNFPSFQVLNMSL